jgi:hypothetical protein
MRAHLLPLLVPVAGALGCTGEISPARPGDAEATTTSAIVVVERSMDATGTPHAQASARFVRFSASSSTDDAMRSIGAALALPSRRACAHLASSPDQMAPDEPAPIVELVDVGGVSMEAAGVETRLIPRQLPDITDVVSGVVYARSGDPAILPAGASYAVHISGGSALAGFDVAAKAPGDPSDVRLSGEDPPGSLRVRGPSIGFAWAPDDRADLIYVDVRPGGVRCVLGEDDGGAEVLRGEVTASVLDDEGTLVIHRLHRLVVRQGGLASLEIRFDFSRSVSYVRSR